MTMQLVITDVKHQNKNISNTESMNANLAVKSYLDQLRQVPMLWKGSPFQCWDCYWPKHKDAKIFENHLNPVMLVFIG